MAFLHGCTVKGDSEQGRKQEVNREIKQKSLQQIALYNLFGFFSPNYWFTLPLTFRFSSVCFFLWEESYVRHLINAYMEMFPICLQMRHACFLLGTWQFSTLKWNWTHAICCMGRLQGAKMNISQCWWFCYSVLSSENISKHPLQTAFLRKDPFN